MDGQLLLFLVCCYGGLLFAIAWWAERHGQGIRAAWWRPMVYSLSIGVYCSSWTFLGAVGQAVDNGWHYLPIYLGPILLLTFGWRFIQKLLVISQQNKVTSIADFIGSRYGKSQSLAAIVTLVLVVGTLPYIALQLRGVGLAWSGLQWHDLEASFENASSLIAAIVMAWFAIVFGTRTIDGPDRLRGMVTAVAAESIVKLIAFIVVAILAIRLLPNQAELTGLAQPNFQLSQITSPLFVTELLLAATAIICLPRQFHVMVVEYQNPSEAKLARWLTPLYLAAFAVFAIPLAQAGALLFNGLNLSPDSYVLTLPRWSGNEWVLALTFIGAISAATGMVVVATIALSIMISNELIVPIWLTPKHKKNHPEKTQDLARSLRLIRRGSIIAILFLSWLLERFMSQTEGLASIGLISFAACAQLLPAVLAALYWQKGHAKGVISGLLVGLALWFYCLLLPSILSANHPLVTEGLLGLDFLKPYGLLGLGQLDTLSHGVFISLTFNCLTFLLVSRYSKFSPLDIRQAKRFSRIFSPERRRQLDMSPSSVEVNQLQNLIEPLFGLERSQNLWQSFERQVGHRLLPHDYAPEFALNAIESDLAAIIGAASANRAMELLAGEQPLKLQDFVSLVSGSSRQIHFSQTLLQTTLETIPQGISVVDKDLKLVAWNQQYQKIFHYPQRLLYVGCDIKSIYIFNAKRGYLNDSSDDQGAIVEKRMAQLRSGQPYRLERELPDKKVIEIRGTPLDNGGYVTTYTDITDYHEIVEELEQSKSHLEERVNTRTQELLHSNDLLQRENDLRARTEQELKTVHASKSRFLAAASHDLLQPINAARLFAASIDAQIKNTNNPRLSQDCIAMDDALQQAEQLISSLREIARLSSGKEHANKEHFCLDTLLKPLANEAKILAHKKGLNFHFVASSVWVYSDPHLLRRVLQNFISNALRYTQTGRIVLGVRREKQHASIQVWDTGVGIAEDARSIIFEEFERLPGSPGNQGLGLGLSIAQRISQLLSHPIEIQSKVGKGSMFAISAPIGQAKQVMVTHKQTDPNLQNTQVLCIDNDQRILAGMQSLLEQWGCNVVTAMDLGQALAFWTSPNAPQIILADFHLEHETGLDVLEALRYHWQFEIPAIIISADNSEEIRQQVSMGNCEFIAKPVPPALLRATMRKLKTIKMV